MQSKIGLNELEGLLREREAGFRDIVVSAAEVRMEPERGDLVIVGERRPVQDHVLDLVGPRLKVPASYLRRCPPWLRAQNVNHWMAGLGHRNLLVRLDGDAVRAVLSMRYVPVSNLDLVRRLTAFLPEGGGVEVVYTLEETRMVCQVVLPRFRRLMAVGDEVFGGVNVVNSEVGFASVEVAGFLHRLICKNGAVVRVRGVSFRRVHLAVDLLAGVEGAFERTLEGLPRSLEAMARAREVPLGDPVKALEDLPRRHGLSEAEHAAVMTAWAGEPGSTLYAMLNAMTGAARDQGLPVESRLRLQTLAGDLLPAA